MGWLAAWKGYSDSELSPSVSDPERAIGVLAHGLDMDSTSPSAPPYQKTTSKRRACHESTWVEHQGFHPQTFQKNLFAMRELLWRAWSMAKNNIRLARFGLTEVKDRILEQLTANTDAVTSALRLTRQRAHWAHARWIQGPRFL